MNVLNSTTSRTAWGYVMGISNTCGDLVNEDHPIYLVGGFNLPL